jgi:outer membrane protein OmpA-like peptidoglycan-associated protein
VRDGKEIWIDVYPMNDGADYTISIVEREAMQQDVVANAAALKAGLREAGHVEVPGILFDTNQSVLKPESAAAVAEVAKLLKADPALKVWVVGHTDASGVASSNLTLSNARAAAVVKALVETHGIAAARLGPFGAGPYAPVAPNTTEAGRAKNRRVELVAQQ